MGREQQCLDKMLPADWNFTLTELSKPSRMTEATTKDLAAPVKVVENASSPAFYRVPGQYLYEDVLLGSGIPPHRMDEIRNMDIHQDDVIIASYPKTGTTLLQEIVWLINNHGDVDLANQQFNYERILFIEFTPQHVLDEITNTRHFKTHVPHRFLPRSVHKHQSKIVYIMRNPKDVLVSYYHFYRMCIPLGNYKGTWDEFFQMFIQNDGKLYYGNMFDHMLAYWNRRNDRNLHIVFYEDILRNPHQKIQEIAEFLDKDLTVVELEKIVHATQFTTMKDNPKTNWSSLTDEVDFSISPFMRRGVVGDWKLHFTESQNLIFDKMCEARLENSGLEFVYEW